MSIELQMKEIPLNSKGVEKPNQLGNWYQVLFKKMTWTPLPAKHGVFWQSSRENISEISIMNILTRSRSYHFTSFFPWAGYWTFLSLSFLISKNGDSKSTYIVKNLEK